MRNQIWRRLAAVAIAALAFAASASAQQYGPSTGALPAYGPTAPTVISPPGFVMSAPLVPPVQASVPAGRLPAVRSFVMQSTGQYWCSNCPNNGLCNNGAGSFPADVGFIFGPTKSFFAPCGPLVLPANWGSGACHGCKNCRTPILGRGPCGPWPYCTYDSYLNH
ncbi:MAG TPA: hypothetical protein VGL71_11285 [Urbifossiella sp.]